MHSWNLIGSYWKIASLGRKGKEKLGWKVPFSGKKVLDWFVDFVYIEIARSEDDWALMGQTTSVAGVSLWLLKTELKERGNSDGQSC